MAGKVISIKPRYRPALGVSHYPVRSRLWDGLSREEINAVLAAASERQVPASTVIVNQNDPANLFFLLSRGSARHFYITEDGRKVLLRWLLPGDVTGGRALLRERACYLVSTEAIKDSSLVVWPRKELHDLMTKYPMLAENAVSFASEYLAWFLASHLALVSQNARERVANVVLSLAEGIGQRTSRGIEVNITNEELANSANVTLFTACRILSTWRHGGALSKYRGKLVLHSPERLLPHTHAVSV